MMAERSTLASGVFVSSRRPISYLGAHGALDVVKAPQRLRRLPELIAPRLERPLWGFGVSGRRSDQNDEGNECSGGSNIWAWPGWSEFGIWVTVRVVGPGQDGPGAVWVLAGAGRRQRAELVAGRVAGRDLAGDQVAGPGGVGGAAMGCGGAGIAEGVGPTPTPNPSPASRERGRQLNRTMDGRRRAMGARSLFLCPQPLAPSPKDWEKGKKVA